MTRSHHLNIPQPSVRSRWRYETCSQRRSSLRKENSNTQDSTHARFDVNLASSQVEAIARPESKRVTDLSSLRPFHHLPTAICGRDNQHLAHKPVSTRVCTHTHVCDTPVGHSSIPQRFQAHVTRRALSLTHRPSVHLKSSNKALKEPC